MAVVALKSNRVTNADASVQTLDKVTLNHGRKRSICATIELANGDSIGSTYRMARVHSSWRLTRIDLYCDAITSGAADLGLYKIASAGGAVVTAGLYATAQSIASAIVTGTNINFEAKDIANIERQVWQDAGQTTDPNLWYDLTLTLTAATTAAGTVSLEVEYVAND